MKLNTRRSYPGQLELTLPLLELVHELGGRAKPKDVIPALAEKLGIDIKAQNESFVYDPEGVNRTRFPFRQTIHWARLNLVHQGLFGRETRGVWEVSEKGAEALQMAAPGVVIVIYETKNGMALWGEAESAVGVIRKNTMNLLFMSPPYPLNNPRAYGNRTEADHIQWIVNMSKDWKERLVDDGSLMLNMGSVWMPGQPCQSAYEERILLGLLDEAKFHLAQKLYWHNPVKIPNTPWVTIKRVRVNPAVEMIYWLGKTPHPKANNLEVLTPYKADMLRRLEKGKKYRPSPSNHLTSKNPFAKDHGGAIPHTLLEFSNTVSNDRYMEGCRKAGLPIHPARFPRGIVEFGVKLTTNKGDLCGDLMSGSNVLGEVCEDLDRNWIVNERSLSYTLGGALRFNKIPA